MSKPPVAAMEVEPPSRTTAYPEPFAGLMAGRVKRRLGDHFGLNSFGVNLTRLAPGAISALLHHHSAQDEFIYVLEGTPSLVVGEREFLLFPGDCMGFRAGEGVAHQLVNRSDVPAVYLEVGDRASGDTVAYPADDLVATRMDDGVWSFSHRDGRPY